jgi:hypothetical protein
MTNWLLNLRHTILVTLTPVVGLRTPGEHRLAAASI